MIHIFKFRHVLGYLVESFIQIQSYGTFQKEYHTKQFSFY